LYAAFAIVDSLPYLFATALDSWLSDELLVRLTISSANFPAIT
jgi:hypothetical protein